MGTLAGHLLPAVAFLLYALYYSALLSLTMLRGQRLPKPPVFIRKKHGHRWQQVTYEGMVKVVMPLIGITCELFYPPGVNRLPMVDWKDAGRSFINKDSWQHITMYSFFLTSGVVDIVSHACLARPSPKLERAAEAAAFYVLVLLMSAHVENKSALEIRVHALFMLPCFLVALVLSVEIWAPDQPPLWVFKAWMGLVLSTWLLQLCVIMYAPPTGQRWRADNPTDLSFLTFFFCWHLVLGAALLAAIYGLCSLWHHRYSSWTESPGARYQPCAAEPSSEELEKLQAESVLPVGDICRLKLSL